MNKKITIDGLTIDSFELKNATIDEVSGFMTAPVTLARTGVQNYLGYELDMTGDNALKTFGVYRPAAEVFDKKSIDTFVNLVSTNDHPAMPVTVSNVKDLQVGTVSGVAADKTEGVLKGILTITDQVAIDKIKSGKVEVSVGYAHNMRKEKGTFDGLDYDFVQSDIEANHLAIVDAGRCGSACKITIDHKTKENTMIVTIDGIKFEDVNDQLGQAIQKQQSAYDAEFKKIEKKSDKDEEEMEKLKKEKDKVEAEKDSLSADAGKYSADAISKLVTDKALLLTQAKDILGDKMPECTTCDQEIKAAVVDKVSGIDVSGKSVDYIAAAYDMAIDKAKKTKGALDKLGADFQNDDDKDTRQTSHDAYVKNLTDGGKK